MKSCWGRYDDEREGGEVDERILCADEVEEFGRSLFLVGELFNAVSDQLVRTKEESFA